MKKYYVWQMAATAETLTLHNYNETFFYSLETALHSGPEMDRYERGR